jgi:hypothetical protein
MRGHFKVTAETNTNKDQEQTSGQRNKKKQKERSSSPGAASKHPNLGLPYPWGSTKGSTCLQKNNNCSNNFYRFYIDLFDKQ